MSIEDAFDQFWRNFVEKDSRRPDFPKSYRNQLKAAFTQGYLAGAKDCEEESMTLHSSDSGER